MAVGSMFSSHRISEYCRNKLRTLRIVATISDKTSVNSGKYIPRPTKTILNLLIHRVSFWYTRCYDYEN
jgi:hypothetical protein